MRAMVFRSMLATATLNVLLSLPKLSGSSAPHVCHHRESVVSELELRQPEEGLRAPPCQAAVVGEYSSTGCQCQWWHPFLGDCPRHRAWSEHEHRSTQVPLLPVRAVTLEANAGCAEVPHPPTGGSASCSDRHIRDFTGRPSIGEGRHGRSFHHPEAVEEQGLQMAPAEPEKEVQPRPEGCPCRFCEGRLATDSCRVAGKVVNVLGRSCVVNAPGKRDRALQLLLGSCLAHVEEASRR